MAFILYRRDESSEDGKETYLATGLTTLSNYHPQVATGWLLIHDPIVTLRDHGEDDWHIEAEPFPRAVRATLAQSLNLAIHLQDHQFSA
jgi:hypothetical protein